MDRNRFRKLQQGCNGPGGLDCPCCTTGDRVYHKHLSTKKARRLVKAETAAAYDQMLEDIDADLEELRDFFDYEDW